MRDRVALRMTALAARHIPESAGLAIHVRGALDIPAYLNLDTMVQLFPPVIEPVCLVMPVWAVHVTQASVAPARTVQVFVNKERHSSIRLPRVTMDSNRRQKATCAPRRAGTIMPKINCCFVKWN